MGQQVVQLGAAVVDAYFFEGYPVASSAVAVYYGSQTKKVEGTQLNDLRATGFTYGTIVPVIRGRGRTAGAVIWASDKRPVANVTSQGKGGGVEQTTYTYEQDVLYLLSDGIKGGIARIWFNKELVYTALDGSNVDSVSASYNNGKWTALNFYSGAPNQQPDPIYEAAVGVGRAPAYRGRTTVMVEGVNLGSSGQLPLIEFEVIETPGLGLGDVVDGPYVDLGSTFAMGSAKAQNTQTLRVHMGQWTNTYARSDVVIKDINIFTGEVSSVGGYNVDSPSDNVATGTTDVPLLHMSQGTTGKSYLGAGRKFTFTYPEDLGGIQVRFGRAGSDIVFGSYGVGSKRLHRYASNGGTAPIASSAVLADYVNCILIVQGIVYAASKNSGVVFVLDLASLTLQRTITRPYSDSWPVLVNLNNQIVLLSVNATFNVHVLNSDNTWTGIGNLSANQVPDSDYYPSIGAYGSVLVGGLFRPSGGAPYKYSTWSAPVTLQAGTVDLGDEVRYLCGLAGLQSSQVDASALNGTAVDGYRATAVTSVRSLLETLAAGYYFECVESDKLYFRKRGGSSVAAIQFESLGAGDEQPIEDLGEPQRGNSEEVPARVSLSYLNLSDNYQNGAEFSDRLAAAGGDTRQLSLPIVMTPAKARGVAETLAVDTRVGATKFKSALTMELAELEPTDVVTLYDDKGIAYRVRITSESITMGRRAFEAVLDEPAALIASGTTDETREIDTTVLSTSETEAKFLDIPILQDADDKPGIYVALKPKTAGRWLGGRALRSKDNVTYEAGADASRAAVMGTCTTALGFWTGGLLFDEVNSVTVNVGRGTLANASRDDLLNGNANAALVGSEVIQFCTATLVSTGVYKLTRLLRGRRGTEWAKSGHAIGDRFVLLADNGLVKTEIDPTLIGRNFYWRSATLGTTVDTTAEPDVVQDTGEAVRPFQPVDLRIDRSTDATTVVLSWKRRTRYATRFAGASGSYVPLGEQSEKYRVSIYPSDIITGLPVADPLRVYESTSSTFTYPAADFKTDAPGYLFNTMHVEVQQVAANGLLSRKLYKALTIPSFEVLSVPPPAPGATAIRAFFRYTPATDSSAFALSVAEYGGAGDGSTQISGVALNPPSGKWSVTMDPSVLTGASAATRYVTNGSTGRTAASATGVATLQYESGPASFFGFSRNGSGQLQQQVVNTSGAVTSTTTVLLDGAATPLLPSHIITFGGNRMAFGSLGRSLFAFQQSSGANWTTISGWAVPALTGYFPTIEAVDTLNSGAELYVAVRWSDFDAPTTAPPEYLRVYCLTGGTWSMVANILLNTGGGLTASGGSTNSIVYPSASGRAFIRVGGKLAVYFQVSGAVGGAGPGSYVAMSNTAGTTWTTSKCTVDGADLRQPLRFVGVPSGNYVVARWTQDFGFSTAQAKLCRSTNGINFTTVSDASTWTTGYANSPGDYLPGDGSTVGDMRAPLFSDGETIVFERNLRG